MSELVFKACGIAVISSMLILLVKKWGSDLAVTLKIASGICIAAVCLGAVSPVISYVRELADMGESAGLASSVEFMLRGLSVAVVSHVSATVCRDCGEGSIGGYVELAGKIEIIILSLPFVKNMIEMTTGLL